MGWRAWTLGDVALTNEPNPSRPATSTLKLMPERLRRPDLDERFKIVTDDSEDALRRLLEVPIDEDDPAEDEHAA